MMNALHSGSLLFLSLRNNEGVCPISRDLCQIQGYGFAPGATLNKQSCLLCSATTTSIVGLNRKTSGDTGS
jgi:hypothetical protein